MTMKTIVVGLGNPLLGDDGVGWRIAEEVLMSLSADQPAHDNIDVECLALGGLSLMEHLIGYDRAILVDAIELPDISPGHVQKFSLNDLPDYAAGHLSSTHDTTLPKAIQVGKSLGARLPDDIQIISVQSPFIYNFSETLSPAVAAAIPIAVKLVIDELANEKSDIAEQ